MVDSLDKDLDPVQAIVSEQNKQLNNVERLSLFRKIVEKDALITTAPLLPLLFNLRGKPYTLINHFPFESFFRLRMPRNVVLKAGRQVSKSTSLAAQMIMQANCIPYFNTLTVTPLFEQARRISSNYVEPFIKTSPVKALWTDTTTVNSVLQRSFKNESRLFFSFALLDADRVRGINADKIAIDEVQDMDRDHLPIIKETMSGSVDWGIQQFTGTPKTLDNTLQGLWSDSSQAEWIIKCHNAGCGYYNVPAMDYDLDKMIGGYRDDISEESPGTICAKCGKPISPRRFGRWVHRRPDMRWSFAGYHIPQIIMPMHYAKPEKWAILLGKQRGLGNTTTAMFYNEVLGESYDSGTKLVTETDLKNAAKLPHNNIESEAVLAKNNNYMMRVLGVDWGGGGEDGVSFTTVVVLGIRPDGIIDVIYGKKLLTPHDHFAEARECLRIFQLFECHMMAHDYTGAGHAREAIMVHSGLPLDRLMPIQLVRTGHFNILQFIPATPMHGRDYWRMDKARSLQLTCQAIKLQQIRFFKYDHKSAEEPGLLHDFLALIENKIPTNAGGDIYTIQRNPMFSDDFAQAVNFGACCLWHSSGNWPKLSEFSSIHLTAAQTMALGGYDNNDWRSDSPMDGYFS